MPERDLKAAIVDVSCGATTGDAVWIAVGYDSRDRIGKRHVAAIVEGHVGGIAFSDGRLIVRHGDIKVFGQSSEIQGVAVSFVKEGRSGDQEDSTRQQ